MALQTLTTTPMPTGTETASEPGPSDTNANSNLLGGSGPTPLVPAFILSGLLVIGMVIMCWWRRVAMRRSGGSGGVGIARYGEDGRVGVIGGGRVGIVMLASGWQDEIDAMRRMRERAGEVKLGPKPLLWDAYLKNGNGEGKEKWRDMKPISAGYIPSQSQNPVSPRNNSTNSPTDERRTLDSDTTTAESKSPTSPSSHTTSPQNRVRISVLISMPTPQPNHAEDNTDAPTKRKSNVSSVMEMNKDKDKEEMEGARLGELNVALGITDVPVVQCKR